MPPLSVQYPAGKHRAAARTVTRTHPPPVMPPRASTPHTPPPTRLHSPTPPPPSPPRTRRRSARNRHDEVCEPAPRIRRSEPRRTSARLSQLLHALHQDSDQRLSFMRQVMTEFPTAVEGRDGGRARSREFQQWMAAIQPNQQLPGRGDPVWYGEISITLPQVTAKVTLCAFQYSVRGKKPVQGMDSWPSVLKVEQENLEEAEKVLDKVGRASSMWFVRLSPVDAFGLERADGDFVNAIERMMERHVVAVVKLQESALYLWPLTFPPFGEALVGVVADVE